MQQRSSSIFRWAIVALVLLGSSLAVRPARAWQPPSPSLERIEEPEHRPFDRQQVQDWDPADPFYFVLWGQVISSAEELSPTQSAPLFILETNPPDQQQYEVQLPPDVPVPAKGDWVRVLGPGCSSSVFSSEVFLCLEALVLWTNPDGLAGQWHLEFDQRSSEPVGLVGVVNREGLLGVLQPTPETEKYLEAMGKRKWPDPFVVLRVYLREQGLSALYALYVREEDTYAVKLLDELLPAPASVPTATPTATVEPLPTPPTPTQPPAGPGLQATPTLPPTPTQAPTAVRGLLQQPFRLAVISLLVLLVAAAAVGLIIVLRRRRRKKEPAVVEPPPRQQIVCPKCQKVNQPRARFCSGCGATLPEVGRPAVPLTPPAAPGPAPTPATPAPTAKLPEPAPRATTVLGPCLIEADGKRYAVRNNTTIGRTEDNDVVIPDQSVSAKHARVLYEHGHFILEDLNSTNGTFVNDRRIVRNLLRDRAKVRFGRVEMVFRESAELGV